MSHQYPPQGPGQPPHGQPPWGPPPPPPKKRHRIRNTFLVIAGVFIVLVIVGVAVGASGGNSGSRSGSVTAASSPSATAPASAAATSAPSSPGPQPPTGIEFVVTGNVPAGQFGDAVDINWGSDSSNHDVQLNDLNGTVTYKMPFDASAEYYALNANIQGGSASCKIVVTGPGDNPLTVSQGNATGNAICSAQAAPENNGLSWDNEQ